MVRLLEKSAGLIVDGSPCQAQTPEPAAQYVQSPAASSLNGIVAAEQRGDERSTKGRHPPFEEADWNCEKRHAGVATGAKLPGIGRWTSTFLPAGPGL
jgi:hypothetical protein